MVCRLDGDNCICCIGGVAGCKEKRLQCWSLLPLEIVELYIKHVCFAMIAFMFVSVSIYGFHVVIVLWYIQVLFY